MCSPLTLNHITPLPLTGRSSLSLVCWLSVLLLLPIGQIGCSDESHPPGSLGACHSGNCLGCCQGDTCIIQTTAAACGTAGFPCVSCDPAQECVGGTCVSSNCSPQNCANGCCQNDQCLGGMSNTACGTSAQRCEDCTLVGQTCNTSTKTCEGTGTACSTQCSGCCKGNQCLSGNADNACGSGGATCADCVQLSKSCDTSTGTCQGSTTACDPSSCDGCCSKDQCVDGTSDNACGSGGSTCADCTSSGQTCDTVQGACTGSPPACGPGSCIGCCNGTQCELGNSLAACGEGGVACDTCNTTFEACVSGLCTVNPNATWEITVISATIDEDPNKTWDPLLLGASQLPDPYVGLDWDNNTNCSQWTLDTPCTDAQDNTYTPSWNQSLGQHLTSAIKNGFCLAVIDLDAGYECSIASTSDTIGLCPIKVLDGDLAQGSLILSSCPYGGINYISSIELKFTLVP